MLDQAHSMYSSHLFDESFSGNRKQFWKYVRSLRKKSFGIPTFLHNNKEFNTSEDKTNVLNTYFQSVFTDEDLSNIPTLGTNTYPSVSSITFSTQGIETILANLDPNKSSGPDNLHLYILKHCTHVIAPILKIIFTQSMSPDSLPTDWLTASITPILKKGNRSSPLNYRPTSLTSICCKTMEHIICHHIMEHLQKNHILTDQQHGFRHGSSCQTQLIALVEDLLHNMDTTLPN